MSDTSENDPAVIAAGTLSPSALVEAAREAQTLNDDPPSGKYAIKVDGEEIDHADTRAEAKRYRDTIVYGGIGTEDNTTIERRRQANASAAHDEEDFAAAEHLRRIAMHDES